MVPALGEPQAGGPITVEWVRNYGLNGVRVTFHRERESLNKGGIPGTEQGAGHAAVNNHLAAPQEEPHRSRGEG